MDWNKNRGEEENDESNTDFSARMWGKCKEKIINIKHFYKENDFFYFLHTSFSLYSWTACE